jgi:enoyl-CoA hydratase/carnithine racemase
MTNEYRWVKLDSRGDGVRVLSLDKPPVNALGRELVDELTRAAQGIGKDVEARCVIVRSAGKHFCAGADLKERRTMTQEEVRRFVPLLAGACNAVAGLPVPTIAAVRGAAAGGGCELALACDMRLLADDAKIGLRETALAIIPAAGGTQRLARLAGPARAKRWILSAEMYGAAEAMRDGVADRVVPAAELDRSAEELALAIAGNGPVAIRAAKRAIDRGLELPLERALELEWECYQETLETRDRVEALEAFAEKRAPRFSGR